MASANIPTKELLHNLFVYQDGLLFWKKMNGKKAGSNTGRYFQTPVNKKLYGNHRLIFMMHHGYLPEIVDHIDGNTHNNRIENLRASTALGNSRNSRLRKDSKTGIKGVTLCKGKYRASISLGCFDNLESAQKAIIDARTRYHGKFANHG